MGQVVTAMGVLAEQRVQHLIHFTRLENLQSILKHGLLSRENLAKLRIPHIVNDDVRLDGMPDAVCLSVSFPNYRMLYAKRMQKPRTDWVILRLRPELVERKRCAFNPTNAASSDVSSTPLPVRMSSTAAVAMFQDRPGVAPRSQLGIPSNFTTDPQAEILVFDVIEPDYIVDIVFDSHRKWISPPAVEFAVREASASYNCEEGPALFGCRADYRYWGGRRHG
jgi:hypothetical protein